MAWPSARATARAKGTGTLGTALSGFGLKGLEAPGHPGVSFNSPEQIIRKLQTAEQLLSKDQTFTDVCRALEVSAPTYHRWQKLYGGMKATEAKRLELEQENSQLKRLLADTEVDKAMHSPLASTKQWDLAEGNF